MENSPFGFFLNKIYSAFNKKTPSSRDPIYKYLEDLTCEYGIFSNTNALNFIADHILNLETFPSNLGKVIITTYFDWQSSNYRPSKLYCQLCSREVGTPGFRLFKNSKGIAFVGKCPCNNDNDPKWDGTPIITDQWLLDHNCNLVHNTPEITKGQTTPGIGIFSRKVYEEGYKTDELLKAYIDFQDNYKYCCDNNFNWPNTDLNNFSDLLNHFFGSRPKVRMSLAEKFKTTY